MLFTSVPTCQPIKHSGVLLHSKLHYSFKNNRKCHGRILSLADDPTWYETKTTARVSFSFLPKWGGGGQNEIAWIIEGTSTYLCAKHVANYRGVWGHAPLGNFEFGHFIRRNLADPWTVFV